MEINDQEDIKKETNDVATKDAVENITMKIQKTRKKYNKQEKLDNNKTKKEKKTKIPKEKKIHAEEEKKDEKKEEVKKERLKLIFKDQPFVLHEDFWDGPHFFEANHWQGQAFLTFNKSHLFFQVLMDIFRLHLK